MLFWNARRCLLPRFEEIIMNETDAKPWLATKLAKASFWLAVGGGIAGSLCRLDILGRSVQADLAFLTLVCCLLAMLFAIVALIRISAADAKSVFTPALSGLLLGLYGDIMLGRWVRANWGKSAAPTSINLWIKPGARHRPNHDDTGQPAAGF